jgi:hypothetical protein
MILASISAGPPGGKGTIRWIGLFGYSAEKAEAAKKTKKTLIKVFNLKRVIIIKPVYFSEIYLLSNY